MITTEKLKIKWYNILFVILGMIIGVFLWIIYTVIDALSDGIHSILD